MVRHLLRLGQQGFRGQELPGYVVRAKIFRPHIFQAVLTWFRKDNGTRWQNKIHDTEGILEIQVYPRNKYRLPLLVGIDQANLQERLAWTSVRECPIDHHSRLMPRECQRADGIVDAMNGDLTRA